MSRVTILQINPGGQNGVPQRRRPVSPNRLGQVIGTDLAASTESRTLLLLCALQHAGSLALAPYARFGTTSWPSLPSRCPFAPISALALRRRVLVWLAGACLHARRRAGLHPIWYCRKDCCYLAETQFWQHHRVSGQLPSLLGLRVLVFASRRASFLDGAAADRLAPQVPYTRSSGACGVCTQALLACAARWGTPRPLSCTLHKWLHLLRAGFSSTPCWPRAA